MLAKLLVHLRRQWMGALALFLVLTGGVAYAANTVFSTDIVDGEVKAQDIATGAVLSGEVANNQIKSADIRDDTLSGGGLTGSDVDESTLGTVPDADKVDGGDLCRTDGPVSINVFGSPQTICTSGSLSLIASCQPPATTPPNYPSHGEVRVASSADDSFAFGTTSGDADLDTGEAVRTLSVTPAATGGAKAAGAGPLAAGNPDGSQLVGSVGIRAVNASSAGATDGSCEFVVGATN